MDSELQELRSSLELRLQRLERLHRVARITALASASPDVMLQQVMKEVAPNGAVSSRIFLKQDDRMVLVADSERDLFPAGSAQDLESNLLAVRAFDGGRPLFIPTAANPGLSSLNSLGFLHVAAMPFSKTGSRGVTVALFRYDTEGHAGLPEYAETLADFLTNAIASRELIERLERSASDSHALARFGHQLEHLSDAGDLVTHALNSLYDQLGLRLIVFADAQNGQFVPRVAFGARNEAEQEKALMPLPLDRGVAATIMRDQLPILIEDYSKLSNAQSQLASFRMRSVIGIPILVDNQVEHMVLAGHDQDDRQFNETELAISTLFVQRLASALQRVRYLDEIRSTRDATFRALGRALEYRDFETHGHTDRVTRLTSEFATALRLPRAEHTGLLWGAYLHDLGKLGIPDGILLKPGKLTPDEFELVKRHTLYGAEMCRDIPFLPASTHQIVLSHHERWDGSGYPDGL